MNIDLSKRCKENTHYKLINTTWNDINLFINKMNNQLPNEDFQICIMDTQHSMDHINYYKCINNICTQVKNSLQFNKKKIFYFQLHERCSYSNYMFLTILFGPSDNENFFNSSYQHIIDVLYDLLHNININNKISIEICKKENTFYFNFFIV
jgi:hypothetical protein